MMRQAAGPSSEPILLLTLSALRRRETVEALGIIGRSGIAEIRSIVGEELRGYTNPDRTRKVSRGFHCDGLFSGPRNVESELIRPDAETAVVGLRLREPRRGGETAKAFSPTLLVGQVIGSRG